MYKPVIPFRSAPKSHGVDQPEAWEIQREDRTEAEEFPLSEELQSNG
jgi:hypothetical protein